MQCTDVSFKALTVTKNEKQNNPKKRGETQGNSLTERYKDDYSLN